MAKTNDIIQVNEQSHMKDTNKTQKNKASTPADGEAIQPSNKDVKFKEVVCPSVPTSYFKRAKNKKQKLKY
nr:DEAD/DEAH box helicase [Providencia rettgeri]